MDQMTFSTTRRPDQSSRGRTSEDIAPHTRAQIYCLLVGMMSSRLCCGISRTDLDNRSAARSVLEAAGFGEASVALLLDRAIDAARITLNATVQADDRDV